MWKLLSRCLSHYALSISDPCCTPILNVCASVNLVLQMWTRWSTLLAKHNCLTKQQHYSLLVFVFSQKTLWACVCMLAFLSWRLTTVVLQSTCFELSSAQICTALGTLCSLFSRASREFDCGGLTAVIWRNLFVVLVRFQPTCGQ